MCPYSLSPSATSVVRLTMSVTAPVAMHEDRGSYLASRRYEDQGSERTSTGAINLTSDTSWRATLSVPLPNADAVFLWIERTGRLPDGYRGAEESAGLSVPVAELEVVVAVLTEVIAQARRDGVLA
jgi:hypothetical protein